MTLKELLSQIDNIDDDLTIYASAAPEITPESEAIATLEPEAGDIPAEAKGMRYLLEVFLAKEVIDVWGKWRQGVKPTPEQMSEAVIYFAENDAYLPV